MLDFYTHFDSIIKRLYRKIEREKGKVITKVEFRIQNVKLAYKKGNSFYIRPQLFNKVTNFDGFLANFAKKFFLKNTMIK